MGPESQLAINPRHKSRPVKVNQPSIGWIKFITPSSSFGPSLECHALESAQISWISPLSASLIFLDLALVIGSTGTCNGSLNALWFSSKYLRKSCYHHIEYPAANFLAVFIWRKSLNSAVLVTTTHRRLERISDGTSTQVVAQMINKCRIKIVQRELYNVRDTPWIGDPKITRETL